MYDYPPWWTISAGTHRDFFNSPAAGKKDGGTDVLFTPDDPNLSPLRLAPAVAGAVVYNKGLPARGVGLQTRLSTGSTDARVAGNPASERR